MAEQSKGLFLVHLQVQQKVAVSSVPRSRSLQAALQSLGEPRANGKLTPLFCARRDVKLIISPRPRPVGLSQSQGPACLPMAWFETFCMPRGEESRMWAGDDNTPA